MGFLNKLIGSSLAETAEGVAAAADKFVETPDEKSAINQVMARMAQEPGLAQVELSKIGAANRSVLIAGWRPTIGYVCAIGLAFAFIINPLIQ